MLGGTAPAVAIVFAAIAAILIGLAVRDFLLAEGKLTVGRRVLLRTSFIFSAVAIGLFIWHTFFA